jgi:hypothetical protein
MGNLYYKILRMLNKKIMEVCKKCIRRKNFFNNRLCTGSGDEEFREMTVDSPHAQRKELTAEEEKLLYGSDDERRMEKNEDTEMRESEDEDEARRRAEKRRTRRICGPDMLSSQREFGGERKKGKRG